MVMVRLSDQEKQEVVRYLEADRPLPDKYRFLLFEDRREVELVWNGKTHEVCTIVLPFQTIEHVDEPRAEKPEDTKAQMALFDARGRQRKGWTNKLIWGDNKLILSSLKDGPLRGEIEQQGGLKLISIDPPFDVGADFSMDIEVGGDTLTKKPNILEEIAYRDTWGKGADSFIAMIYERLVLMRDLLAEDGSIYVHCDWRVTSYIREVLDEIFGRENIRNELIWTFTGPGSPGMKQYNRKHNTVYWYSKSKENWIFEDTAIRTAHDKKTAENFKSGLEGSGFQADTYELPKGKIPESWWEMAIAQRFPVDGIKRVGYPTEKPWTLLERIIRGGSRKGDIVADFFCGGGTLPAVAESAERKWIAADLGKFAIHTTRKRMIGVQRQLKAEGRDYRAFEILNLGKYERQHFVGLNPNLREEEQRHQAEAKETVFLDLILKAYRAERVENFAAFHGTKAGRLVTVGPVNLPVTRLFVEEIMLECRKKRMTKVDILGFEFEMGLFPNVLDEARAKGIDIAPKYIPAEVFDKRAVEKNQVVFHDVSFIEVRPRVKTGKKTQPATVAIELTDFSVFYLQDSIANAEAALTANTKAGSKIVVERGQIVRLSKDGSGSVTREPLTRHWTDWIDYWSVDFDFESKREIISVQNPETGTIEEQWTGDFIFENEWQSFRTRKDRRLELTSVAHECRPGRRKIAVKVVDIFGNDTMTIVEVTV